MGGEGVFLKPLCQHHHGLFFFSGQGHTRLPVVEFLCFSALLYNHHSLTHTFCPCSTLMVPSEPHKHSSKKQKLQQQVSWKVVSAYATSQRQLRSLVCGRLRRARSATARSLADHFMMVLEPEPVPGSRSGKCCKCRTGYKCPCLFVALTNGRILRHCLSCLVESNKQPQHVCSTNGLTLEQAVHELWGSEEDDPQQQELGQLARLLNRQSLERFFGGGDEDLPCAAAYSPCNLAPVSPWGLEDLDSSPPSGSLAGSLLPHESPNSWSKSPFDTPSRCHSKEEQVQETEWESEEERALEPPRRGRRMSPGTRTVRLHVSTSFLSRLFPLLSVCTLTVSDMLLCCAAGHLREQPSPPPSQVTRERRTHSPL